MVDYAEARVEQLAALVPLLASSATPACPVRVLLTVRGKRPGKPWLSGLLGSGDAFDVLVSQARLDVLSEHRLEGAARAELFRAANRAFVGYRARSGKTARAGVAPATLESDVYSNPLMVVIAAYLAVEDAIGTPATSDELLDALLDHEERYWRRAAAGLPVTVDDAQCRRVVALATVTGADSEAEATELVSLVPELSDAPRERRAQLARFAERLYPGNRYWNQLGPDVVAEHLVASSVTVSVTFQRFRRGSPSSHLPARLGPSSQVAPSRQGAGVLGAQQAGPVGGDGLQEGYGLVRAAGRPVGDREVGPSPEGVGALGTQQAGTGGTCSSCGEPVAFDELLDA
jgi:hypothetical protein